MQKYTGSRLSQLCPVDCLLARSRLILPLNTGLELQFTAPRSYSSSSSDSKHPVSKSRLRTNDSTHSPSRPLFSLHRTCHKRANWWNQKCRSWPHNWDQLRQPTRVPDRIREKRRAAFLYLHACPRVISGFLLLLRKNRPAICVSHVDTLRNQRANARER